MISNPVSAKKASVSFKTRHSAAISLILLIIPLLIIICSHTITRQGIIPAAEHLLALPVWLAAEYFLILFTVCITYALTSLLSISFLIPSALLTVICLISYHKMIINGFPMLLNDFTLFTQFGEIISLSSSMIKISTQTVFTIIFEIILFSTLILADIKLKKDKLIRATTAIFSVIFILFLSITDNVLLSNDTTHTQEARISKYGPLMGMYTTYAHDKRNASLYTPDSINRVISQLDGLEEKTPIQLSKKPTVIFLMSESFFDVTKLPNIHFDTDPIPVFHSLAANCTSGDFVSNTYCGGTGYVEMEVLTGLCSNLLKETDTLTSLPSEDIYQRLPVISDIFKNYGYQTAFIHSHNDELYNRRTIYTDLGFDQVLFEEDFNAPQYRGGYISDMELSKKIISTYEQNNSMPMFLYAVSMENHQPFSNEKFNGEEKVKFHSDFLTGDAKSVLNGYVNGLNDADTALGYLINYFEKENEPVMIVFFGDHLPNLGTPNGSVYKQLGYSTTDTTTDWQPNELKKMLSTDYLIWTNYESEPLPDTIEASTSLGLSVLNRLNFRLNTYYSWLNKYVYPSVLMYRSQLFVDSQSNTFSDIPLTHRQTMFDYQIAMYDIIYGDNLIFKQ